MAIILISSSKSFSQKNQLNLKEVGWHIHDGIYNNYHPDSIALSKLCRHACIFIKFKVNTKGQISNLSFSKDSALFIKDALTKAVYSLQKDQKLIDVLKKSGRTIIQPIAYAYETGCNLPKGSVFNSDALITEKERDQQAIKYFRIHDTIDHFGENLMNMLNFGNGALYNTTEDNVNVLDNCILLRPIQVSNIAME